MDEVRPTHSGLGVVSWKVSAGHLRHSERLTGVQPRIPVESKNVVKEDERGQVKIDWRGSLYGFVPKQACAITFVSMCFGVTLIFYRKAQFFSMKITLKKSEIQSTHC